MVWAGSRSRRLVQRTPWQEASLGRFRPGPPSDAKKSLVHAGQRRQFSRCAGGLTFSYILIIEYYTVPDGQFSGFESNAANGESGGSLRLVSERTSVKSALVTTEQQ